MTEITNAHLAADIVLITRRDGMDHVLLIRRRWEPYAGCWALPGGYLDQGETFAEAAARELAEETGLHNAGALTTVGLYDTPNRDPRGRVVSVAHMAILPNMPAPTAGDDAREARWVPINEALTDIDLAFDHRVILQDAIQADIALLTADEGNAAEMLDDWVARMRSLLGKRVQVTRQRQPHTVVITGELMWFNEGGEVVLRNEHGFVGWPWPHLEIHAVENDES
jgi:8-oxo-dGTP diphosphatase